jgi:hypothetical protein
MVVDSDDVISFLIKVSTSAGEGNPDITHS